MREMVKMFVVLTVLSAFSGGLLAGLRSSTAAQIENQKLEFVKGPAIKMILKGASNDPIKDRFKIMDGKTERSFFVGKFDGKASTVVFESFGKGFGGDIGLMMGVNDLAVSSGSACTSASLEPSYVLRALGVEEELAHTSLRIGLGRFTTEEEVDYAVEKIATEVTRLREMSPLWDMAQEGIDLKSIEWADH